MTKLFEPYAYYLGIDEDIGRLTLGKLMKGYHNIRKLARAVCEAKTKLHKLTLKRKTEIQDDWLEDQITLAAVVFNERIVALRKAVE